MPSLLEKLQILGEAAKYDLCAATSTPRGGTKTGVFGKSSTAGICHSFLPDGRCVSLLKVLLSNRCIHDCHYCINSTSRISSKLKRCFVQFTPEELVKLTLNFYLRNYIEGLFLSSAIDGSATEQSELIYETIYTLRVKYNFSGYIHAKVLPGIAKDELKRIAELSDRVSLNIELPNRSSFSEVCSTKDYNTDLLRPVSWMSNFYKHGYSPAGLTTQYVIGSANETDKEVLDRVFYLYSKNIDFKRQYFSTYYPIESPKSTASIDLTRESRLYQIDWLYRIYKFKQKEVYNILNDEGQIPLNTDPKILMARNSEIFPLDINSSSYFDLIKVPGIGPTSAKRIIELQKQQISINKTKQLASVGVVLKRAIPFIKFKGNYQKTMEEWIK